MKPKQLTLNGNNLTIQDLSDFILNPKSELAISNTALKFCEKTRTFLDYSIKNEANVVYGINTGFGPMADYIIPKSDIIKLQYNLILSHAVGMGNYLPDNFVLSAMIVRLNTLAKGYSGASQALLKHLAFYINNRIIPQVPEHGAVGTSGDLVQLAHIALGLIGKGKVNYKGKTEKTEKIQNRLKIKNYDLKPKEGLSLINGTSMMAGIAALAYQHGKKLLDLSVSTGAMSLEIVSAFNDSYDKKLHELRPHPGQIEIAERLSKILASSKRIRDRKEINSKFNGGSSVNRISEKVQEVYSLRCIAQILGPVTDTLKKARTEIETEMNSVTDNPIIDAETKRFLHGGNFHGEYISQCMDQLKIGLVKLTMLSERRINFFLNPNIEKGLPPFLNMGVPGLTLGLQGLQFVATSTTANSQTLAFPMSVHSISTNGDNQDLVSMGTDSTLFAHKVIDNAYIVISIELITLCQAIDYLKIQNQLSGKTLNLYKFVRKIIPTVIQDENIGENQEKLLQALKQIQTLPQ